MPVSCRIEQNDYEAASCLIQQDGRGFEKWSLPAEGLHMYDWYAKTGQKLEDPHQFTLDAFSDCFFLLTPIVKGWSVIGRSDKYLLPAAVETVLAEENELILRMTESGPLLLWSEGEPSAISFEDSGYSPQQAGPGLWSFSLPVGRRSMTVKVNR